MEDYGIIMSIIILLLTQLFYIHRIIGKLEAKLNYCIREIKRLNNQIELLINKHYEVLNGGNNA